LVDSLYYDIDLFRTEKFSFKSDVEEDISPTFIIGSIEKVILHDFV